MTRAEVSTVSRAHLEFAYLAADEERKALVEENHALKVQLFAERQHSLGARVGLALVRGSRLPDVGDDDDMRRTADGCPL